MKFLLSTFIMILLVGCNPMGNDSIVEIKDEFTNKVETFSVEISLTSPETAQPQTLPITYSITFSSSPVSFTTTDINFVGIANVSKFNITGSGKNYILSVQAIESGSVGTIIPEIASGLLNDANSASNSKSTISSSDIVTIMGPVLSVSSGNTNTCALLSTGLIKCWGENGAELDGESTVPAELDSEGEASMVSAGGGYTSAFACGVTSLFKTVCWGDPSTNMNTTPSAELALDNTTKTVSVGFDHACGISLDGKVFCWGNNGWGQTTVPVDLQITGSAKSISAGANHSCALKSDGSVTCWGLDSFQQSTVPAEVDSAGEAIAISTGSRHTCALKTNGSITCWGLPDSINPAVVSTEVDGAGESLALDLGGLHSCASKSDESVICWEDDSNSQSSIPASLTLPYSTLSISAGDQHTCVVQRDGTLNCFGSNISGQLNIPAGL